MIMERTETGEGEENLGTGKLEVTLNENAPAVDAHLVDFVPYMGAGIYAMRDKNFSSFGKQVAYTATIGLWNVGWIASNFVMPFVAKYMVNELLG